MFKILYMGSSGCIHPNHSNIVTGKYLFACQVGILAQTIHKWARFSEIIYISTLGMVKCSQ